MSEFEWEPIDEIDAKLIIPDLVKLPISCFNFRYWAVKVGRPPILKMVVKNKSFFFNKSLDKRF